MKIEGGEGEKRERGSTGCLENIVRSIYWYGANRAVHFFFV